MQQLRSAVVLVTGIMASGKSTVAQLLAERLPRSVHLRGDGFRRMIVSGREEFTPHPTAEATAQLRLRYEASATVADLYAQAGWTVIVQDVVLGEHLDAYLDSVTARPLYLIVLAPRPEAVAAREAGRHKKGYGGPWTVDILDDALRRDTPPRGLWLDTSNQTPHQTVDQILADLVTARIVDRESTSEGR
ncbi:AAA family ATPase [Streptomyces sp. NPDC051963]|uniref:AAA family ATPase n=1 Tax=Streptomyces sp. NPDC051963 TaxID=3365678 RepID=UPI0037D2A73A